MIHSSWEFGTACQTVPALRESASLPPYGKHDEKSLHLVLFEDELPIACGSLYCHEGQYYLEGLCVTPAFQKKHVGDLLIRVLAVRAFRMMADSLCLVSPEATVGFFQKYGFAVQKEDQGGFAMLVTPETLVMTSKCGHDCTACIHQGDCHEKA